MENPNSGVVEPDEMDYKRDPRDLPAVPRPGGRRVHRVAPARRSRPAVPGGRRRDGSLAVQERPRGVSRSPHPRPSALSRGCGEGWGERCLLRRGALPHRPACAVGRRTATARCAGARRARRSSPGSARAERRLRARSRGAELPAPLPSHPPRRRAASAAAAARRSSSESSRWPARSTSRSRALDSAASGLEPAGACVLEQSRRRGSDGMAATCKRSIRSNPARPFPAGDRSRLVLHPRTLARNDSPVTVGEPQHLDALHFERLDLAGRVGAAHRDPAVHDREPVVEHAYRRFRPGGDIDREEAFVRTRMERDVRVPGESHAARHRADEIRLEQRTERRGILGHERGVEGVDGREHCWPGGVEVTGVRGKRREAGSR
ncbi:MAG: hypothetical protein MZV70_43035 [Desulfobacterales bacterium]|nr:hypothetical protein [Desulfobacterales bacterium]